MNSTKMADFTQLDNWLSQYADREEYIAALTIWRENRGGGILGMHSVLNVIQNRSKRKGVSFEEVCKAPLQFSSISYASDRQIALFPIAGDKTFSQAVSLAYSATAGILSDLTNGSTVYYNPDAINSARIEIFPVGPVKFPPSWNLSKLRFQREIANHLFFVEV